MKRGHLSEDQVLKIVDEGEALESFPHLSQCHHCLRWVEQLKEVRQLASRVEIESPNETFLFRMRAQTHRAALAMSGGQHGILSRFEGFWSGQNLKPFPVLVLGLFCLVTTAIMVHQLSLRWEMEKQMRTTPSKSASESDSINSPPSPSIASAPPSTISAPPESRRERRIQTTARKSPSARSVNALPPGSITPPHPEPDAPSPHWENLFESQIGDGLRLSIRNPLGSEVFDEIATLSNEERAEFVNSLRQESRTDYKTY